MKYQELTRLLREAGYSPRQGKGDHEVWKNGTETVVITQTREISPGLTAKALKSIERSKEEDQ